MHKTVVLDVVGLTQGLITAANTPFLHSYLGRDAAEPSSAATDGGDAAAARLRVVEPTFPALTCTAQATYLTGQAPAAHGIVGNGW